MELKLDQKNPKLFQAQVVVLVVWKQTISISYWSLWKQILEFLSKDQVLYIGRDVSLVH